MITALHHALARAREDTEVQAVTLVGTGEAFSAGADLKAFISRRPPLEQALERRELGALLVVIDAYSKPLVAVEAARFGLPGVRLGIMPMTIMPAIARSLPRKLGLELILTGRLMSAREAVNRFRPPWTTPTPA